MKYGIPYKGSKSKIAKELIDFLPKGERFVDLFGGGFAMSHCALLSRKYKQVYYNDYNPLLKPLIEKAINGYFNYDKFKPEFISREMFEKLKNKDGYIKYIWSFGNNGRDYLFGKDVEKYKKLAHNAVVFRDKDSLKELLEIVPSLKFDSNDIKSSRLNLRQAVRIDTPHLTRGEREQLQQLQQLERLQQLQQLKHLERLERLELNSSSYKDYVYRKGDIVYCDPPYEFSGQYDEKFDSLGFYDWVYNSTFPIYFSSYKISDKRFHKIWEKDVRTTLSASSNNVKRSECLYTNDSGLEIRTPQVKYTTKKLF